MHTGKLVFAQLTDHLPLTTFRRCVARYGGEHKIKRFTCLEQFLCLAFAQLTYRESLRDIEACLRSQGEKLYHMGIRSRISRSTLADANEVRDWRIYADYAQRLIGMARKLYVDEPFGVDPKETVYALDTTTIDLCLSVFPWAPFRRAKAAVKLHTLLDLRGNIPSFIHISDGKVHEVNVLDRLVPEAGAFYIMDRGFLDFERLFRFHAAGSFFVTRGKSNLKVERRYSRKVDRSTGIFCDQSVMLTGFYAQRDFDALLRRIRFKDPKTGKRLIFLTNNFALPPLTIADLYRCRWQVELFFKWIKQHLRIKQFYGTSENAVKTQIWSAVAVYVLVAIVRKRLKITASLYEMLQILSLTM
ncbi:MAG: IS4 family transposase, partial [Steroidobacteraceae bacterium]